MDIAGNSPTDLQTTDWHALSPDQSLARAESRIDGISSAEAQRRLEDWGPNSLPEPVRIGPLRRFLAQFNSGLIYFLLAAALASFMLGHVIDGAVIGSVILVNAIVGFVQEGKAEQALRAIGHLISRQAMVKRDGQRTSVSADELVPGDIVLLEAGQKVPADARIVRARAMSVDEALLTGESLTADKSSAAVAAETPLGDRSSMVFSGTLVKTGQATAVVTATGRATEIGKIGGMLQEVTELSTPLLRQINRFATRFTRVMLVGSILLFAFLVWMRQFEWSEALIMVVALAVGLIPEGLPAVITITLAIGVRRMAVRHALIRKLPAVETLGAVSVICTDKTGTLTRNEMMVREVFAGNAQVQVGGSGYAPEGELAGTQGGPDETRIAVRELALCGLLCGDARLEQGESGWWVEGDPMEGALIAFAMKAGLDPSHERREWPRLDEIPFDAMHRYMATLHQSPEGGHVVFIKGAPEAVLRMIGDPAVSKEWGERISGAAAAGERLLGFATKRVDDSVNALAPDLLKTGVEPLGLAGFIDPPREEAQDAVAECRRAGIEIKMITGDHAATALAIARQLRLADEPKAMTGTEIERLGEEDLLDAVEEISVFARASPEHKLRIVRALQARGHIVAMTGDGVNDAPSLKQADVGTAMGQKGSEASREAAKMVLLDDNFASIVAAVHEGRTVYDNIRKVIAWTLPTNGGESVIVLLAILMGFTLPMTATQILWINLVTDSALGLALAFEPSERGVMERPPRRANAALLSAFMLWRVLLVSFLFAAISLGIFFTALDTGRSVETARTMVVNMLVGAGIFYLFNVRYLRAGSITLRGALGTKAVLLAVGAVVSAQLIFTYLPLMNRIFASRPLSISELALILFSAVMLMLLLEGEKLLMRRLGWFEELRAVRP